MSTSIDFALDPFPGPELHSALAALRAQAELAPVTFLGLDAWLVTSYDALDEAFRDSESFPPHLMYQRAIEPVFGRSFLSMDEPDHLTYRRLATPAFRSRAVESFSETGLAALAHELIDTIDPRAPFDLVPAFTERFPYLVISRMLGVPRDMEDQFHRWSIAILEFGRAPDKARESAKALTDYLIPVVAERRRNPQNDVISELVHTEVEGRRLSDEEILSHIRMLFPTGGETTHSSIGNTVYGLLTHDGLWDAIVRDPTRIVAAVEEGLRWETPVSVLPRISANEEITFRGVRLPADSWVLFAIGAANRDPAVYDNPDSFDIDRFATPIGAKPAPGRPPRPPEPLTFGRGPKSCPGLHLARENMRVALEALSERLPGLHLLDADAAVPSGLAPRSVHSLSVSAQ
jgi:cytochrome P450